MGLFDQFKYQPPQEQQVDPRQEQKAFQNDLASLKANPIAYAKAHGKSIPENMTDPNQMIQYLLSSTQVNNPRYQMALQFLGRMSGKR